MTTRADDDLPTPAGPNVESGPTVDAAGDQGPASPDPPGPPDDPRLAGGTIVTLADGGRILVRPLRPDDRNELAERYLQLSPEARRLRFFNAPDRLSKRLLDFLMDVDGATRCAFVALALDDDGAPGVGLARYARSRNEPDAAEAAVTVLDGYHHRGIATVLLHRLAQQARANGITTFVASVMWENRHLLDALRDRGAVIEHGEPGVASVRIALPDPEDDTPESSLHETLRVFADRLGDAVGLRFVQAQRRRP